LSTFNLPYRIAKLFDRPSYIAQTTVTSSSRVQEQHRRRHWRTVPTNQPSTVNLDPWPGNPQTGQWTMFMLFSK